MDIIRMDRSLLPPEEHEAADSIQHNLIMLQMIAEEFRQTADLYLFAHTVKSADDPSRARAHLTMELLGWIKIAGRNGAIVAESFSKMMQAINKARAPAIWARANLAEREAATKLFASEFPRIASIRTSAAHPGELSKSREEQQRHRITKSATYGGIHLGEGSDAFLSDIMNGGPDKLIFGASFRGEWVEYELSIAKANVLKTVADHYCKTFYALEHPSAAQQRVWMRESDERRQQDQNSRPPWWHSLLRP